MKKTLFAALAGAAAATCTVLLVPAPEAKAACLSSNSTNNCVTFDPTTDSFVQKDFTQSVFGQILSASDNLFQLEFAALQGTPPPVAYNLTDLKLDLTFSDLGLKTFTFANAAILANDVTNTPPLSVYLSEIKSLATPSSGNTLTKALLSYTIVGNPGNTNPSSSGLVLEDVLFTGIRANDTNQTYISTDPLLSFYNNPNRVCTSPILGQCTFNAGENGYASVQPQVETSKVPGPLPILGAGVAFMSSRKLRRRIKSAARV